MNNSEKEDSAKFELSREVKEKIRGFFEKDESWDLIELTRKVFNNDSLDGRSKEGRAIKKYVSEFKIGKVKSTTPELGVLTLSEDQIKELESLMTRADFSSFAAAKKIFNNDLIYKSSREVRTVNHYIDLLKKAAEKRAETLKADFEHFGVILDDSKIKKGELAQDDYRYPTTVVTTIARINKYLNLGWKESDLKKIELKRVQALMGYLRIFRFRYQINSYSRMDDRELFEDAFIRYTYDKEDLTQEELDQFITLANEVVIASDVQRRIDYLRQALDSMAQDSEGKKINMGLNDAINNAQTEYNQCISRQEKLYKALTINRSKRMEQMQSENSSILNLVFAWKQEEYREKMIMLAEKQKQALSEEVEKTSSVEDWKAIIKGLDPKEVLY